MQLEMDRIAFQLYEIWGIPGTWNGKGKDVVARKYKRKMRNPKLFCQDCNMHEGESEPGDR